MADLHRTHRFIEGHMVKADPPEWFAKAVAGSGDWPRSLGEAGASMMEDFDGAGESLEIYEGPQGDYFIGYWDAAKCVAEIFIDNVADYMLFRATYIAPLAKLIMESDRYDEWRKAKNIKFAS